MSDLITQSIQRLRAGGVQLDRGLSDEEVSRVQDRFNFVFGPEHREFIQSAVPVGKWWLDWRNDTDEDLRGRLDWPLEGVLFDVRNNDFWPASWGDRPDAKDDREREARAHLAGVAVLIPVFSVYQTDVIFYGDNLVNYLAHEFHFGPLHPSERTHVPFWSDLAEGAENRDL